MDPSAILLFLTIVMPRNVADINYVHREPTMEQCFADAAEYMRAEKPPVKDAVAIRASCQGPIAEEQPS